jgi:2',3'-cyclic-nucleotide 2'-phosphodiesterase (5'-nucleotidase family)
VSLQRLSESRFTWIGTNVNDSATQSTFGPSVRHVILNVHQNPKDLTSPSVKVILIGITVADNKGKGNYVSINSQAELIPFVNNYLKPLKAAGAFDICVALTHLEFEPQDSQLAQGVPLIDIIIGGWYKPQYLHWTI